MLDGGVARRTDIAPIRVMRAAVAYLSRMSHSGANQQHLHERAFVYAAILGVPVPALEWREVIIGRINRAWQDLFGMAPLFVRNRYQTTSRGSGQGTARLSEAKALFEEHVGRLVTRALAGAMLVCVLIAPTPSNMN